MSNRPSDPRTQAREAVMQMIYAMQLTGQSSGEVERWYVQNHPLEAEVRELAGRLLESAVANDERIRELLTRHSHGWRLERMSTVDRSLLMLGVTELLREPPVPAAVVITETLKLARRFSQPAAENFLHGVLDAVAGELRRQKAEAAGQPGE